MTGEPQALASALPGAPTWLHVGALVDYLDSGGGAQSAIVKAVHTDDPPILYCTVAIDGVGERQTPLSRLLPRGEHSHTQPCSELAAVQEAEMVSEGDSYSLDMGRPLVDTVARNSQVRTSHRMSAAHVENAQLSLNPAAAELPMAHVDLGGAALMEASNASAALVATSGAMVSMDIVNAQSFVENEDFSGEDKAALQGILGIDGSPADSEFNQAEQSLL